MRAHAPALLMQLIWAACAHAACAPGDLEQEAINVAYMESVARLDVPAAVHAVAPQLCAGFLGWLEGEGRLGGGREMGTYLIAMQSQYAEVASGRSKPVKNPGSKLGRNDPCPCGSGKKYKKCCLNR